MKINLSLNNIIILLLIILFVLTLYSFVTKKNVKENFNMNDNNDTLMFFSAGWCPHCTKFKPVWNKLIDENKNGNKFKMFDLDKEEDAMYFKNYDIQYFPTIIYQNKFGQHIIYEGDRTKKDINKFIKENIKN